MSGQISRQLQMVGATAEGPSEDHAWFFGANHDYYLEMPSGRIVAEVSQQQSRFGNPNDTIWCVTWVEFLKPGPITADTPAQEYYVTRRAARQVVEDKYGLLKQIMSMIN